MTIEANSPDMSVDRKPIAISEAAKRQIAAAVLRSKAHSLDAAMGPSFLDGFPETFPDGPPPA